MEFPLRWCVRWGVHVEPSPATQLVLVWLALVGAVGADVGTVGVGVGIVGADVSVSVAGADSARGAVGAAVGVVGGPVGAMTVGDSDRRRFRWSPSGSLTAGSSVCSSVCSSERPPVNPSEWFEGSLDSPTEGS